MSADKKSAAAPTFAAVREMADALLIAGAVLVAGGVAAIAAAAFGWLVAAGVAAVVLGSGMAYGALKYAQAAELERRDAGRRGEADGRTPGIEP